LDPMFETLLGGADIVSDLFFCPLDGLKRLEGKQRKKEFMG